MAEKDRAVQSVFRAANERLRERLQGLTLNGRMPVVCECSDQDCLEVADVVVEDYRRIRRDGNFIVLPGHDLEELEDVVERYDGYDVVRKHASADGSGDV